MAFALVLGLFGVPQSTEAAITLVGSASSTGASASFNVDLTVLSLQEDDVLIVMNGFSTTADGDPGVSTAGYTEISDLYANGTSNDANVSLNWKVMSSSPDTTIACNGSGSATRGSLCLVQAWRGVDTTTPMDVTETEATGTGAGIPDGPSITPSTSGAYVLVAGAGFAAAPDTAVTAPSGYSNQISTTTDPGTAATGAMASIAWTSGAEDPAAWTNWATTGTGASWGAVTMALRPASDPFVPDVSITSDVIFDLDLDIVGALSKGSGTFVIDHPLQPKTHLLYHSFLESPDVKNIYDGVATLNVSGEATIRLPDYFEALNKDFRYQFFPLDEAMPELHIAKEMHNNQFTIGGGKPQGRISWQITGIRHDPYIKANPIEVEVEKRADTKIPAGQCIFEPLCQVE